MKYVLFGILENSMIHDQAYFFSFFYMQNIIFRNVSYPAKKLILIFYDFLWNKKQLKWRNALI